MTKLECEVVKPHMQVYCSPKLAEHAARHAGRNAVLCRGTVLATPSPSHWRWPRIRGDPSRRRPSTIFGAGPDLDVRSTPFTGKSLPRRSVTSSLPSLEL